MRTLQYFQGTFLKDKIVPPLPSHYNSYLADAFIRRDLPLIRLGGGPPEAMWG